MSSAWRTPLASSLCEQPRSSSDSRARKSRKVAFIGSGAVPVLVHRSLQLQKSRKMDLVNATPYLLVDSAEPAKPLPGGGDDSKPDVRFDHFDDQAAVRAYAHAGTHSANCKESADRSRWQEREPDLGPETKRRPAKRKHSPPPPSLASGPDAATVALQTPPSQSPAPPASADPSDIANPPVLVPHSLNLPESEFEFWSTRSHPFNKHGYRYTPCGPSLGTPLPVPPQRTIESFPKGVHWSWEDRSQFTLLTEGARTITTDKGWRAARSNVGIREGAWYWEIKVERGGGDGGRDKGGEGQGSWVRPGVGRRESPLNAPVGIDG